MSDADMYDEFGNYIGAEIGVDSEDAASDSGSSDGDQLR
jgi:hypothetical protein